MEKHAIWYGLLLKAQLKKRITWIQIFMMLILLWFVRAIKLPETSNINVGMYYGQSISAGRIGECLMESGSMFDFVEYDSMETLEKAVTAGSVECGFGFTDDFDDRMAEGNIYRSVSYFATPMSAKGEVIQETVYTAFLQIYSEKLLEECESNLYGVHDSQRYTVILEKNQSYLNGSDLFDIEITTVETDASENEPIYDTYLSQGILGVYLFLILLLAYGRKFETGRSAFCLSQCRKERGWYEFLDLMASATLPAIVGLAVVLLLPESRGIGRELTAMLLFLLYSAVWIMAWGRVLKRELNLISGTVMITLTELLICPIFWEGSRYIPAIKYLRFCFPLGLYLYI